MIYFIEKTKQGYKCWGTSDETVEKYGGITKFMKPSIECICHSEEATRVALETILKIEEMKRRGEKIRVW